MANKHIPENAAVRHDRRSWMDNLGVHNPLLPNESEHHQDETLIRSLLELGGLSSGAHDRGQPTSYRSQQE